MSRTQLLEKNIEYLPVVYLTSSLKQLYQQCDRLADETHRSILITGESGTGKELLAKSIHYNRAPNAPFVTMNCVNLPLDHFEEKIESCFANFTSSADTDAERLTLPVSPTLFLRDIGKLEKKLKKDLLTLLSDRVQEAYAAGTDKVQLIFSSKNTFEQPHPPVFDRASLKTFNPYLLNILPLRSRCEDIKPLAVFFLDKFSKEYGKDIGGIHSKALALLEGYEWPENVSELRDVMENAVLLAEGPLITRDDIRYNISKKSIALESFLSREDFFSLEEIEHIYINTVLRRVKNNKSKAAKILGISRNTLQRRIETLEETAVRKKSRKKTTRNQPRLFKNL